MKHCSDCKFCIDDSHCSKLKRGFTQAGGCSYYKRDIELFNENRLREEFGMRDNFFYSQDYTRCDEKYDEDI